MTALAAYGDATVAPRRMSVLGIRVDCMRMDEAVQEIGMLAGGTKPHMIFLRDVASLMVAVDLPALRQLHDEATLVLPDGMPLVWHGRLHGYGDNIGRVAGSDLLEAMAAASTGRPLRHYFYGGDAGISQAMARNLQSRHPDLCIAGTLSPPQRMIGADLTLDRSSLQELDAIRAARPDIIWVGLSSPKQEFWIREASRTLGTGVFIGIGAAFDFHAGSKRRAPPWMQRAGLEWLHRLLSEPRRLWYRYLVLAPRFVVLVAWQALFGREV